MRISGSAMSPYNFSTTLSTSLAAKQFYSMCIVQLILHLNTLITIYNNKVNDVIN